MSPHAPAYVRAYPKTRILLQRLRWAWGDSQEEDHDFLGRHTYLLAGTYQVTAAVYSALGETTMQTLTVFVGPDVGAMVLIPAGTFRMGCDRAGPHGIHGSSDEKPYHMVCLDAYYVDRYEVSNARYRVGFRCVWSKNR